jgi:hypothetical protein
MGLCCGVCVLFYCCASADDCSTGSVSQHTFWLKAADVDQHQDEDGQASFEGMDRKAVT